MSATDRKLEKKQIHRGQKKKTERIHKKGKKSAIGARAMTMLCATERAGKGAKKKGQQTGLEIGCVRTTRITLAEEVT
jgi:hypothetical protein